MLELLFRRHRSIRQHVRAEAPKVGARREKGRAPSVLLGGFFDLAQLVEHFSEHVYDGQVLGGR